MASFQSRIAELATAIAVHTHRIDSYLVEKRLSQLSFEADGPGDLGLPPDIEQCRAAVLEASQGPNDLLRGPRNLIPNTSGEIAFADLAAMIGVDCAVLRRILRFAIAWRVMKEPRPGVVVHSAPDNSYITLTDNYPWDSPGSGTLVDVGGSHGDAALAMARKYPKLRLVVQEVPKEVANSKEKAGLNVEFMGRDFFEERPVNEAEDAQGLGPRFEAGLPYLAMDLVLPVPVCFLTASSGVEADPRFAFQDIQQPPALSNLAILMVLWEG
ncbi:hypothetical protein DL765_005613 [Monosporascus sp. GIB2]|nr:hypothetical protein DL765_005613 [Monosporascus sp. GIB2]